MEKDDVRQKILTTAGRIFASKGFAATTVREICAQADVNLAAVNYYFGDKDNLYYEAVCWARNSRAAANPLPQSDAGPETRLRHFIQTLVKRTAGIDEPPWEVQLILREILFPSPACRRLIEDYFRPFFHQLLEIVEELAPSRLTEEAAYRIGYSIIGQVMYLRFTARMKSMFLSEQMVEHHFQQDQIAEHVFQFSLAALKSNDFWQSTGNPGKSSTALSNHSSVSKSTRFNARSSS